MRVSCHSESATEQKDEDTHRGHILGAQWLLVSESDRRQEGVVASGVLLCHLADISQKASFTSMFSQNPKAFSSNASQESLSFLAYYKKYSCYSRNNFFLSKCLLIVETWVCGAILDHVMTLENSATEAFSLML